MTDKTDRDALVKEINDQIDRAVEDAGYAIYGVGPGERTPSFTLTLGRLQGSLEDDVQNHDFLMVGVDGGTCANIINQTVELGVNPDSAESFMLADFPNIKFKFDEVDLEDSYTAYYLSTLAKYQIRVGGDSKINVKQIIYSDDQGKFLGDVGCKLSQVEIQYPPTTKEEDNDAGGQD